MLNRLSWEMGMMSVIPRRDLGSKRALIFPKKNLSDPA